MPYMHCPACGKRYPPLEGDSVCVHIKDAEAIIRFSFWFIKERGIKITMDDIMEYLQQLNTNSANSKRTK